MTQTTGPQEPVHPLWKIKPPLIGFALIGIGIGINFAATARIFPEGWIQFAVGVPVIIAGLAFGLVANMTFRKMATDFSFSKPPSLIVQHGLFKISRNPMYVAMVVIVLGAMLVVNSAWSLLMVPVAFLYLQYGVIHREEQYLELWFGDEYRNYKTKVRRWV